MTKNEQIMISTDFVSFITACNIPNVGIEQATLLRNYLDSRMEEYKISVDKPNESYDLMGCFKWLWLTVLYEEDFDFTCIDGFTKKISDSINEWSAEELNIEDDDFGRTTKTEALLSHLVFTDKPL